MNAIKKVACDELGTAVAEAVMKAAVEIIHERGLKTADVDTGALVVALRREAKAVIGRILEDGKDLLDAGRSPWLSTLFSVECVGAARAAVESVLG